MCNKLVRQILTLSVLLGNAALYGQIGQQRPELCGKREFVPTPSNVLVTQEALIVSPPNSSTVVKTNFFGTIEQVCPIQSGRYLVFVQAPSGGSYEIIILNGKTGAVMDRFRTYNPVVSPDQHWMVYQAFYPRGSDPSDEYLLYDLSKNAAENTMPKPSWFTESMRGKVIYPVVADGTPFHNIGLPDEQRHGCLSGFFWSNDSTAVVFGDRLQDSSAIILVILNPTGTKTLIHRIAPREANGLGAFTDMEVNSETKVVQVRFNDFNTNEKKLMTLHWSNFEAAKLEVHKKLTPLMDTIIVPSLPKNN